MKKLAAAVIFVCFCACNSASDTGEHPSGTIDSVVQPVDSMSLPDTTGMRIDSLVPPPLLPVDTSASMSIDSMHVFPQEDIRKRYGVLGYSYFKAMQHSETRNINAYVTIFNSPSKVIDTLRQINSDVLPERTSDTASIFTQNISLYAYLNVTLIDPDSSFVIKQVHDSSRQRVDSLADNFWSWAVTPRTKKAQSRLIMKVVAEKPDGSHEPFQARSIPITISLDPALGRSLYSWLYENPEKLLVLILIPLVTFFWKQIVGVFQKKPEKK